MAKKPTKEISDPESVVKGHKHTENALRKSEEHLSFLDISMEHSPFAMWISDSEGTLVRTNRALRETLNMTNDQLLGKYNVLKDENLNKQGIMTQAASVFEKRIPARFSIFWKGAETGEIDFENAPDLWIDVSMFPIEDNEGNLANVVCQWVDITDRKQAEDELKWELNLNKAKADIFREIMSQHYDIKKISEITLNYARQLTHSRHGFVFSIDRDTLENVGHTYTHKFGILDHHKTKRAVFLIDKASYHKGLYELAINAKKSLFSNQPAELLNTEGLPGDHVQLKNQLATPVIIGNTLAGLIGLADSDRNYTDKDIEASERLAEIYALALHRHQYEMDKVKLEKQLQHMQKIEAIGTLAGGIAHDFNNLLFPIVGISEMLLEDFAPDSPEHESIREIFKAAKRGSDLVKQILAFSRQSEHKMIPVKLQQILNDTFKLSRSTIPTSIRITQDIQTDCGFVLADPTQLHQVAMNLITNAYHAVEDNGGDISISLKETELMGGDWHNSPLNPGNYAKLTVSDTGIGIEKKFLDKIFEPYFTTKEQGKGTGLGLAVVHGIIKELKGDIRIYSEFGEGTTINVYLPLLKSVSNISDSERVFELKTGTEKILLVDDEESIVKIEKLILERFGYHVTACNGSVDALKIFESNPGAFDLVITDMSMPNMSGDRLSMNITSIRPEIPIILCTGFSEKFGLEKAKSLGIKGVLMKPVVSSDMARMVRKVLDETKSFGI